MSSLESAGVGDFICLKAPLPAELHSLRNDHFVARTAELQSITSQHQQPAPAAAFALSLQREEFPSGGVHVGRRPVRVVPFPKGAMSLVTLARTPLSAKESKSDFFDFL